VLHRADLPSSLQNHGLAMSQEPRALAAAAPGSVEPLDSMERRAIVEALAFTSGDRTSAAQMLGIGRTTLYRKLKEYGIE
ncbi:MAG: helix-turn-helix domain-containing protein, partial [Bryobacteraceae bacterium]